MRGIGAFGQSPQEVLLFCYLVTPFGFSPPANFGVGRWGKL